MTVPIKLPSVVRVTTHAIVRLRERSGATALSTRAATAILVQAVRDYQPILKLTAYHIPFRFFGLDFLAAVAIDGDPPECSVTTVLWDHEKGMTR